MSERIGKSAFFKQIGGRVTVNALVIKERLKQFFIEDIGDGDITSESIISSTQHGYGKIIAKEDGVLCGSNIVTIGYELLAKDVHVQFYKEEGESFRKGDIVAKVEGPVLSLLAGERVLLNLLQRLSGIATKTASAITSLNDETIRICDTRKTTPGLRQFEKYAVRCGGGFNHRFGLNEAVLLKENHLLAGGGITNTIKKIRAQIGHMVKVEVETTNEQEVKEAVQAGADIIMFDNASPTQIKKYMQYVPKNIVTEASGGITLADLPSFRGCGVHYISLGCLTHSAKAIDLSFLLKEEE